jgi:hypothetical protein
MHHMVSKNRRVKTYALSERGVCCILPDDVFLQRTNRKKDVAEKRTGSIVFRSTRKWNVSRVTRRSTSCACILVIRIVE